MTKRKLRKNAEINPPQSPHDGIHTCSKGCNKPGCTRALRDTIEEQDQQIEALKRDVLEKAAELRKSEEHNDALCERMKDLNSELFAASNINGKLHMNRVHDLNQMGEQCEEIARLRSVAEDNKRECEATRIENARLKAENTRLKTEVDHLMVFCNCTLIPNKELQAQVERLTKAGNELIHGLAPGGSEYSMNENIERWNAAKEGKGQP